MGRGFPSGHDALVQALLRARHHRRGDPGPDRTGPGRKGIRMSESIRDRCAIVGIGQTDFSKDSGRTEAGLAAEAISAAVDDAGLSMDEVDGVVKFTMDSNSEISIVSNLGLKNLRFWGEAGYGGSSHCAVVGHAAMAISLGMADVVVCFRALNERSGRRF